jgi:sulfur carrier protein ThiS
MVKSFAIKIKYDCIDIATHERTTEWTIKMKPTLFLSVTYQKKVEEINTRMEDILRTLHFKTDRIIVALDSGAIAIYRSDDKIFVCCNSSQLSLVLLFRFRKSWWGQKLKLNLELLDVDSDPNLVSIESFVDKALFFVSELAATNLASSAAALSNLKTLVAAIYRRYKPTDVHTSYCTECSNFKVLLKCTDLINQPQLHPQRLQHHLFVQLSSNKDNRPLIIYHPNPVIGNDFQVDDTLTLQDIHQLYWTLQLLLTI